MASSGSNGSQRRDHNTPIPHDSTLSQVFGVVQDFHLTIQYPSRLRLNRVEEARVVLAPVAPVQHASGLARPKAGDPLPVRLVIPGAVVTPPEAGLVPQPSGPSEMIFHVSPLATGFLPEARVDLLREGEIDSIRLRMRVCGRGWVAMLAILALTLPLLLQLPAAAPQWAANGSVERAIMDWMPRIPIRSDAAIAAQDCFNWLASTGAQVHLSFFSLMGIVALAVVWCAWRWPRVVTVQGENFALGATPRSIDPPTYLTPVRADELGPVRPS